MKSPYLSKSNFKVARTCATKLYYLKKGYPSSKEGNEYLEFLADGGFAIGKMAQLMYPSGTEIDPKPGIEKALETTQQYLSNDSTILFEAALLYEQRLALVDILVKQGQEVQLIEVKSKSFDSTTDTFQTNKGTIRSEWREYLEDVCYQTLICEQLYPDLNITPCLYLPDKSKTTSIEGLASWFKLVDTSAPGSTRREIEVEFLGDEDELRADSFLTLVDVSPEVEILRAEVEAATQEFIASLSSGVSRITTPIGRKCKDCEYRVSLDLEPNGFKECWGSGADITPHILDLYHCTTIKDGPEFLIDKLSRNEKFSLFDVPENVLTGKRGERQLIQLTNTKANTEWINPALAKVINDVEYPLHFIDFETSRTAIPYHAGMRPYENVAFQWSCHTISKPGAKPQHSEWINTEESFPNFEFAKSLMTTVGDKGALLTWSHHENTVLRDVLDQMGRYNHEDQELELWLQNTINSDSSPNRIVDLEKLTKEHYFHPEMKGSTSLKYVLPAIWNNNKSLHDIIWLSKYVGHENEEVLNPYSVLESIEIAGQAETVQEGTGAMRAYQDMVYGLASQDPETKERWKELLLQYCELDTMAMVIVWLKWCSNFDLTY